MAAVLGVPQDPVVEDVGNIRVSRIGGNILLFRSAENPSHVFKCPSCKSFDHVSLISQVFAPEGCNDRILYVLTCSKCSSSSKALNTRKEKIKGKMELVKQNGRPTSFSFALRSQNFNKKLYEKKLKGLSDHPQIHEENGKEGKPMFEEQNEWGDSDDVQCTKETLETHAKVETPEVFGEKIVEEFAVERRNNVLRSKFGSQYTEGIPLDIYCEDLKDIRSIEEEVTRKFGDLSRLVEDGEGETDDTNRLDSLIENYMSIVEQNPLQCIRWNPDGEPLRTSLEEIAVPPCAFCGAERRFELQLTAPTVYFLTKDIGETKNEFLHFSNILVFTCSGNCNSKDAPYIEEFTVTEAEL